MAKTLEYYLSKGFDQKTAEYFASGKKRIVAVKPQADYSLLITFDNGEKRLYDVSPYIKEGTVFSFLADIDNFNRVYVDKQNSIAWDVDPTIDSDVVWNNKVDLCPDGCYIDSVPIEDNLSA